MWQSDIELMGGLPPDGPPGQPDPVEILPADQALSERRAERVSDEKVLEKHVEHRGVRILGRQDRGSRQHRKDGRDLVHDSKVSQHRR
jgi:hypothetical protein